MSSFPLKASAFQITLTPFHLEHALLIRYTFLRFQYEVLLLFPVNKINKLTLLYLYIYNFFNLQHAFFFLYLTFTKIVYQ